MTNATTADPPDDDTRLRPTRLHRPELRHRHWRTNDSVILTGVSCGRRPRRAARCESDRPPMEEGREKSALVAFEAPATNRMMRR